MDEAFHIREAGTKPHLAGGRLTIDLRSLQANYRALAKVAAPAGVAGVVKADAYGIGIADVVPALAAAGCDTFFVALPEEGFAVRRAAPQSRIFVLNGLFGLDAAETYARSQLIPVINTAIDLTIWERFCGRQGAAHPCAIHVDTGMNRLGITPAEAIAFADENMLTRAVNPVLLMSHLACADQRDDPKNRKQLEIFRNVGRAFGEMEASLVNSSGLLLGRDFHFGLTRPGIAVYGGSPAPGVTMRTVVTAEARVAQIRYVKAGETISYGATSVLQRDSIIAVAAVGYADGFPRAASGSGVPIRQLFPGGNGFVNGRRVPIIGRVTMDLTMFDVTDLGADGIATGDHIELFGPNLPIDEAARAAGTISYELLTRLGQRYHRAYISAEPPESKSS
ncbi:alanine racemase [Aquibium sp. LZ166]|uniref:Alanine racemase n=1 Tax=Aquibium pacificus TaxID=3153579 RepID=A0ABV3SPK0_9HYPH